MTRPAALTELDMLSDVIRPDVASLDPNVAESVMQWQFSKRSVARMNVLAKRNRDGRLSEPEREEFERFMRVGGLINLFQAKARQSLRKGSS